MHLDRHSSWASFPPVRGVVPVPVVAPAGLPVLQLPVLLGVAAVLVPLPLRAVPGALLLLLLPRAAAAALPLAGFWPLSFPTTMAIVFAPVSVIFIIRHRSSSLCFLQFGITVFIFWILTSFVVPVLSAVVTISAVGFISVVILWNIISPVRFSYMSVISFRFALGITSFLLLPPSNFLFKGFPSPFLFFPGNFIRFSIFLLCSLPFGFRNIWNYNKLWN